MRSALSAFLQERTSQIPASRSTSSFRPRIAIIPRRLISSRKRYSSFAPLRLCARLRVDSADRACVGYALDSDEIGGGAHVDFFAAGHAGDVDVGAEQDLLHSVIDLIFVPEEVLQVLYPLEVGDDHTARVGEDVRHQIDSAVVENPVGFRACRSIRALDQYP